jgi:alpha-tubulin suppressor-like RCC1 family protein
MKKLLIPVISAVLVISACSFFTFDNPSDPLADNFAGVVKMDGVIAIEDNQGDLVILANGSVYSYDYYGELSPIAGLPEGITAVSYAESGGRLFLDSEGKVYDTTYYQNKPNAVSGIDIPATFIRTYINKFAIGTGTDTTYIWGDFSSGNTNFYYDTPTAMSWGIVKDIAIRSSEMLILKSDGKVYSWNAELTEPEALSGLADIVALSASSSHSLALDSSGRVWAWGANTYGQLGDGTTGEQTLPVLVPGLTGVTAIKAAENRSFALTDTAIYGWGLNINGSMGKFWNSEFHSPVVLGADGKPGGATPVIFSAGSFSTVVYTDTGYLFGFGYYSSVPVCGYLDGWITQVSAFALENTEAVSSGSLGYPYLWSGTKNGGGFGLMLSESGKLTGFGANAKGQMGDGSTDWITTPEDTGLSGFKAVSVGGGHVIALETGGTVKAWGAGDSGQLGNGTSTDSLVPVTVTGLSGITSVAAGNLFSLALKADGTLWGWGTSGYGQIGASGHNTAEAIDGLSGITAVAAGSDHTLALKNDGTVLALGANTVGQLGNGTTDSSDIPVQVSGLTGITAIAASGSMSAALKNDGTVWGWGYSNPNGFSQGDLFLYYTEKPHQIGGVTTAKSIALGAGTILILLDDGSLLRTGESVYLTKRVNRVSPGPYPLDTFAGLIIEKIYGGYFGFMIIDDEGKAYCWLPQL